MPPSPRDMPQRVGEIRPNQLMFTYGVGAIVDLPFLSVLVMGLDDWKVDPSVAPEIQEPRLLSAVRRQVGGQVQKLLAPPAAPELGRSDPFGPEARVGVPVATFPRWMVCPQCHLLASLRTGLFVLKESPYHPDRTRYVHASCSQGREPVVVPARFLVACEYGHQDDFPWVEFVHRGPTECQALLRLVEFGPSDEARDLEVRCESCAAKRRMAEAFGERGRLALPACRGRRPHLRDYDPRACAGELRTILLGASNLWFPDALSTLAIPTDAVGISKAVEEHWARLREIPSPDTLDYLRSQGYLATPLYPYSNAEIWQAILRQRDKEATGRAEEEEETDLKQPEWEHLTQPAAVPAAEHFRLREVAVPTGLEAILEKVVLVERLREVRALIGFTRIDAPGEMGTSPEAAATRRMALARQRPTWVPATEVRGEGIFLQFREDTLTAWLKRAAVQQRDAEFFDSHCRWRRARFIEPEEEEYPGMRYVLLHTVSHALMRQFALECGYAAASVRERLYARSPGESEPHSEPMAGILLYTAAPDSEGTLGGLVTLGESETLGRHLRVALREAALCGSDPLCAEHHPSQRGITLHGAACHACLFAPETSCERGNKYLDRSVLTATVERADLAFFPGAE